MLKLNKKNQNFNKKMSLSQTSPNYTYKINFGESSLMDYINRSAYEEIIQEQETNEILNNLRMKYLPNSVRSNSFNESFNKTFFQKNNSNKLFSTFTDKTTNLDNNIFSKTTYNSFNNFNSNNNNNNLKAYNNEKLIPQYLIEQKDSYNLGESMKLNKENLNSENINVNKINRNDNKDNEYLIEENTNLKKMNDSYKLIISALIEYINDISNYFMGQNTLDMNYIINLLKKKNFKLDNTSTNNLKSKLKEMKNNIIDSNTIKKNQTMPLSNNENNILSFEKPPIIKEKYDEKYQYKPIIFDKNQEYSEKFSKSVDRSGIKKTKTWFERIPKSYWSLNKKVKFRENKKYN